MCVLLSGVDPGRRKLPCNDQSIPLYRIRLIGYLPGIRPGSQSILKPFICSKFSLFVRKEAAPDTWWYRLVPSSISRANYGPSSCAAHKILN